VKQSLWWNSSARPAQSIQRRAKGWKPRVRFSAEVKDFSLLHSIQTVSGAHIGCGRWTPIYI
jgi:hypothetical protein